MSKDGEGFDYDDDDRFGYMDDDYAPSPNAEDAPVRVWAHIEDEGEGVYIEYLSDEPWPGDDPGVEYLKVNPWQDIHDAPHDGTDILTWDGNTQEVLFWSQHGNGWTCGNPKIKHKPTHWMPLPEPPKRQ